MAATPTCGKSWRDCCRWARDGERWDRRDWGGAGDGVQGTGYGGSGHLQRNDAGNAH